MKKVLRDLKTPSDRRMVLTQHFSFNVRFFQTALTWAGSGCALGTVDRIDRSADIARLRTGEKQCDIGCFCRIAEALERFKKRIRIVAVVDSLKHLHKGGRIPAAVAIVGGALGIKPVIALYDSTVKLAGPVHHYLAQNLKIEGALTCQIGATIGTHVGPRATGVAFVAKEAD